MDNLQRTENLIDSPTHPIPKFLLRLAILQLAPATAPVLARLQGQNRLEILECEDEKPIYDASGELIARGLSVRMGIYSGTPLCETDLITHRIDYFYLLVNLSARNQSSALGEQIMRNVEIIHEINMRFLEIDEETEYSKQQSTQAMGAILRGVDNACRRSQA